MNDPGLYTDDDWKRYYRVSLEFAWMRLSPRELKRLRSKHGSLVTAIEGIMKYDRS